MRQRKLRNRGVRQRKGEKNGGARQRKLRNRGVRRRKLRNGGVSQRKGEKRKEQMALSKKRKVDSENRAFNPEWTDSFLFILPTGSTKPVCRICSETVALQSANVKRHYETKDKAFEQTYPLKSEVRSQKISGLRTHNTYTCMFSYMLRDNKYCQKVFELH